VVLSANPEKTFQVLIPDINADTLMAVLRDWFEPSITVISDCWSPYREMETHKNVKHTFGFVDVPTGAHTKTIKSTWRHIKLTLSPYNRIGDNMYHLPQYMFPADSVSENAERFTNFFGIVENMDWSATCTLIYSKVAK
jgi:hypothetical protein